jgi:hypothetical protein
LLLVVGALPLLLLPRLAGGSAQPPADRAPDFDKDVLPILKANCYKCHANGKAKGGLSLADRAGLLKGGDLGPAFNKYRPEESILLKAIHYQGDLEMPPSGKLAAKEVAILTQWVKAGAVWPDAAPAATTTPKGMRITDEDRLYWAYVPVKRPEVPPVGKKEWVRNPIDAFILARLEKEGLAPVSPADRGSLGRRVWYDLTGLPPTPEELDAFVNDPAPDAYERLIDRLLASPQYGEKWARHWLDLVRYAETNGFEFDRPKPFAWRYRDYVIDAFNADKPYDQFLREQLAGDQLEAVTPESLIATGYYRLGQYDSGAADRLLQRYEVLDGILSTTGQVFLGMSLGCARCHDHKRDPIPQRDYYRLLAFFHNVGEPFGKSAAKRMKAGDAEVQIMSVVERGNEPCHVLLRGNPRAPGELVDPGFPEVLSKATPAPSGKGRLALANWLTDAHNPLTARVLVNRLWQYHFGRGIVPSSNDFGKLGEPATHPELLDWLASEFVANGWKIKPMHRLILTSNAYRMSSRADAKALAKDPANGCFWRFPMRRLSAEEVRDSMLAVSGKLNPKRGGPSVYPPIPKEVLMGQSRPGEGWRPSPPEEAARRSVYVHVKRSLLLPLLAQFDLADTDASCPVRFTTTVPTQALGMLNGEFSQEQADALAVRLEKEAPGAIRNQVARGIRLTTGRIPSADETRQDTDFVGALQRENGLNAHEALRCYCLVLLNANEFLYLD